MKFLADAMLGKLARWLRLMGHDTELVREKRDSEVFLKASQEERILLTRDRELAKRRNSYLVKSKNPDEQLKEVISGFHLGVPGSPSRALCPVCNGPLVEKGKEGMEESVPKDVCERESVFWLCGKCGKAYWRGSHWEKIGKKLKALAE